MWLPGQLGLGGPLGGGQQWWSWIHLEDVVAGLTWILEHPQLEGPFNLTSPQPVRQIDFARQLGQVQGRPAFLPAPAWALRLALGGFSQELWEASGCSLGSAETGLLLQTPIWRLP